MAGVAKRLEIAPVDEERPDAAVRFDVVNIRSADASEMGQPLSLGPPCALSAERFLQELCWAEIIHPDGKRIPAMPVGCCCASPGSIFGPVLVTVPGSCQFPASRLCAGTKRFQSHLITSRANKKCLHQISLLAIHGAGTKAQALTEYSRWIPACTFCNAQPGS